MRPIKLKPVSNDSKDPNALRSYFISGPAWIDENGDLFILAGTACNTCNTPIFKPVIGYASITMTLVDDSLKNLHTKKDLDFVCETCLLNLKIIKEQIEIL